MTWRCEDEDANRLALAYCLRHGIDYRSLAPLRPETTRDPVYVIEPCRTCDRTARSIGDVVVSTARGLHCTKDHYGRCNGPLAALAATGVVRGEAYVDDGPPSDDPDWVIDNVIEAAQFARLFAPQKTGKSLLALQWAIESALDGRQVLYVDKENGEHEISKRLHEMYRGLEYATPTGLMVAGPLRDRNFLVYPQTAPITKPNNDLLIHILSRHETPDLVVIDSWVRFTAGGETLADEQAAYTNFVEPLKAEGVAVLALDHTGHSDKKRPRGSSDKGAAVDHGWRLSAVERDDRVSLTVVHLDSRTGRGPAVLAYDRPTVEQVRDGARLWHTIRQPVSDAAGPDGDGEGIDQVGRLVAVLDDLGVPADMGRVRAGRILVAAGVTFKNDNLVAAQVGRRADRPDAVPGVDLGS